MMPTLQNPNYSKDMVVPIIYFAAADSKMHKGFVVMPPFVKILIKYEVPNVLRTKYPVKIYSGPAFVIF